MQASRPESSAELLKFSAFWDFLSEEGRNDADKLLYAPFEGKITAKSGKLVYFNYQVNPSVGYGDESDPANDVHLRAAQDGEFLEVTLDGEKKRYVHYSSIYLPKDDGARKKIGMLNCIYAIIFQNIKSQMAQLNDLLAEATVLNAKLAKLSKLYQIFSFLQASRFDPSKAHNYVAELDKRILREFAVSGIACPFSMAKVGVMPGLYDMRVHFSGGPDGGSSNVYTIIYPSGKGSKKVEVYHFQKGDIATNFDELRKFVGENIPTKFDTPEDINGYIEICESMRTVNFNRDDYGVTSGPITNPGEVVYFRRLAPRYDSASGKWAMAASDVSHDDGKATLDLFYTFIGESLANGREPTRFLATSDDMGQFCDAIRQTSDQYSSKNSNVMSIVSLASSEMQQNFSTCSSLIGKLGDTWRKTAMQS
ncbi:MAG: hypothetical protein LBI39_03030 [Puniceicoccales bacterium]|jgi:hypothetical protein|nr:hypothetical protein [Puniceicoccales bacterium]